MPEPEKLSNLSEPTPEFNELSDLALDMRWSWSHASDNLWARIDPELWEFTHNPWLVYQTASPEKLKNLLADEGFQRELHRLREFQKKTGAIESKTWFDSAYPSSKLDCVAYFSMEFGLSEALPIYSGGLGNVAGDQLKAASDLGVPVVGVGLLYQQGYFRQVIEADGSQRALYPYNDPSQLPVKPLRDKSGEWLRIRVQLPGFAAWMRTWEVKVGRVRLLLLDSNDPANPPAYRGITSELYGGGTELRLQQEMVLGIIGYQMLRQLGIRPQVCHLNEGHAAFAIWERARHYMLETGLPFHTALAATRPGNVFTTHTPVAAGIDQFPPFLFETYMQEYATEHLRVPVQDLLAMGRANPADQNEPFNMAYLGIRGSGFVNGVSQLHAEVSRNMFSHLFPRWPVAEVPVGCVTNGVHVPSWDSTESDELWTKACGSDRWRNELGCVESGIRAVSDEELWSMRCANRANLVNAARSRYQRQLAAQGMWSRPSERDAYIFDPNVLTLGFARRFATYKRPNLLLRNPERLAAILSNSRHPVQLVVAGKAHPADREGQEMIQEWVQFTRWPELRRRVVFLADYDMSLAQELVRGVDVWVNNPRRPWEACGTSGMKVLVNGGLNLSSLDGWWAEAYDSSLGWAVGDNKTFASVREQDDYEAEELYSLLERQVVPLFYDRDHAGIPTGWVNMMRESMARLTGQFSANRCVREYTERFYLPAAECVAKRIEDGGKLAVQIEKWQKDLRTHSPEIRFPHVETVAEENHLAITAQVHLGAIPPEHVRIEVFADNPGSAPFVQEMTCASALIGVFGGFLYKARVPGSRPAEAYTLRIRAAIPHVLSPIEEPFLMWQR